MISRHRLRGRRRFAAVRAVGLRATSGAIRAQAAANAGDVARVGFALVGLRSSVRRNLLRRRLREAVRPLLVRLGGYDVVLVAGQEALELPFAGLCEAVTAASERAVARARSARPASTADNGPMTSSGPPR